MMFIENPQLQKLKGFSAQQKIKYFRYGVNMIVRTTLWVVVASQSERCGFDASFLLLGAVFKVLHTKMYSNTLGYLECHKRKKSHICVQVIY